MLPGVSNSRASHKTQNLLFPWIVTLVCLQENLEELATLESLDNGKPFAVAKAGDVPLVSLPSAEWRAQIRFMPLVGILATFLHTLEE